MRSLHVFLWALMFLCFFLVYSIQPLQRVQSFVVPHHEIVAAIRKDMLLTTSEIERRNVRHIVIIGPNHFNQGKHNIQTTDRIWSTEHGELAPDEELMRLFVAKGAALERESFTLEHAIYNVVGDVRLAFPNATVIPLIIKQGTPREELRVIQGVLKERCTSRCVVIGSVDFSHDQAIPVAELHDSGTKQLLKIKDVEALLKHAEVDAPEVLAILAARAEEKHASWVTYAHTNSGIITNDSVSPTTSHIFGYYTFQSFPLVSSPEISFVIGKYPRISSAVGFSPLHERFQWGFDVSLLVKSFPVNDGLCASTQKDQLTFEVHCAHSATALEYVHSLKDTRTYNKVVAMVIYEDGTIPIAWDATLTPYQGANVDIVIGMTEHGVSAVLYKDTALVEHSVACERSFPCFTTIVGGVTGSSMRVAYVYAQHQAVPPLWSFSVHPASSANSGIWRITPRTVAL